MSMEIRKAERTKSKLRLAIAGPSGAGKTMGALKLARGIGGRVCMIDTERGSGDLYADLYDYDIITLEPPFKPDNYVEAIRKAEAAGYDVIVIDSLSHAWSDEGGLLDQADKLSAKGNRFTVWADLTPQHRRLVNAMLNSPKHIVATMRSKQAYEMETYTDKAGEKKQKPVKIGLAPIQREGMEYEFTVFFDVDYTHNAKASKDRTNMFKDEVFLIDENIGQRIAKWLGTGKTNVREVKREIVSQLRDRLELGVPTDQNDAVEFVRMAVKKLTGLDATDESKLEEIVAALSKIESKGWAYKAVWGSEEKKAPEAEVKVDKPVEPQDPPFTSNKADEAAKE